MKSIPIAGTVGKDAVIRNAGERRVTVEDLKRLLFYDPKTGLLYWKERKPQDCPSGRESEARRWNARYAGKSAFTAKNGTGYFIGAVFKVPLTAHVVGWAIHSGEWPKDQVDHINGDKSDNRAENLRAVTASENARNVRTGTKNTSGRIGVSWVDRDNRWRAYIGQDGGLLNIGHFKTFDEAVAARSAAEVALGYHENHGRTA